MEMIKAPVEWLKEISLVDTPGTNAIIREHQEITEHFVPRSDLVIFVTSSDRAFSESERSFLARISQYKKKIIVVITKKDIVESQSEMDQIVDYVSTNFESCLGSKPEAIFTVDSKGALKAKLESGKNGDLKNSATWKESGFGPVEKFILKTLDREQRTRIKLENPLGLAEHLLEKAKDDIESRSKLLRDDVETLEDMKEQMEQYKEELMEGFLGKKLQIDKLFESMNEKANKFLDDRIQIFKFFDLFNSDKLKADFEKEVVGDVGNEMESKLSALIDWMMGKNSRLWKRTMETVQLLAKSSSKSSRREALDRVNILDFDYDRSSRLSSIGDSASEAIKTFNKEQEANNLANEVKKAIISTAAVEVSAVALGVLLASSVFDVFGIGLMAAGGLVVLPWIRGTLKSEAGKKIQEIRGNLDVALTNHFEHQVDASLQKIQDALEPYSRFVNIEQKRIEKTIQQLDETKKMIAQLRIEIEEAFPNK
eukprot:TRINITY_DN3111_c0_g1_i3.p1 TRINITY_DN3111_c0_g1~~TRINITY_DN3111_c0_g1_i3.p1  ORF type:complete len:483 (+),score=159.95 TRINITY_DN3111_c0_g1_i3:125-1573(+)